MDWQITFLLFTAACSGHIFWQLGKKYGISSTLDYLKADGQIDFDEHMSGTSRKRLSF